MAVRVTHRHLLIVVGALVAAALVGAGLLWPRAPEESVGEEPELAQASDLVDANLIEVVELERDDDPTMLAPEATAVEVVAEIEATGERVTFEMIDETGETFRAGQRVRLAKIEQEGEPPTYFVNDFRRDRPLGVLVALFLAAVIALGRGQGLRALLGLVLTFGIILGFVIPAILDGGSPLVVALVGAVLIMVVTLYLAHGFSAKTSAAAVGTAGALAVTGLLAVVFVAAASITGFTSEEARLAQFEVGGLSLRGLLLAGIIIGGLGVLDDVTMSQSSTVFELQRANPRAGFAELFRGALNVGRDHVAATVNTLFLAYAGAALPLLILFVLGTDALGTVVTTEVVAVEVIRTLVGSIGLVAAVPLTSALAAAVAQERRGTAGAGAAPVEAAVEDWAGAGGAPATGGEGPAGEAAAGAGPPSTADRADEAAEPGPPLGADRADEAAADAAAPPGQPTAAAVDADDEDEEAWVRELRRAYRRRDAPSESDGD